MSVPHLWARKFDETVDSSILDMITDIFTKNDRACPKNS